MATLYYLNFRAATQDAQYYELPYFKKEKTKKNVPSRCNNNFKGLWID